MSTGNENFAHEKRELKPYDDLTLIYKYTDFNRDLIIKELLPHINK